MFDDIALNKALSEVTKQIGSEYSEPITPPNYTEQLNRLNHSSEAANEELRAVNAKLDHAKDEIKTLNETVVQLRRELDEERKKSAKTEKNMQWLSVLVAILSAVISACLPMLFSRLP